MEKTSDVMVYIWIRLGIRFLIVMLVVAGGEIPPQYRWTKEDRVMRLLSMLKQKGNQINFKRDIMAGIIVALVSIPISMGYAQISGLPVVYGLYGSLFPILVFAFLSTSPQFVVGVDAMPAAMVGAMLSELV